MAFSPRDLEPYRLRRRLAAAGWALFALAFLAVFLLELRLDVIKILTQCQGAACHEMAVTPAEAEALQSRGLSPLAYAAFVAGGIVLTVAIYWLLAGLILWRQGISRVGLTVSLTLLVMPSLLFSNSILLVDTSLVFLFLFLYLFPNGRFYPGWAYLPLAVTVLFLILTEFLDNLGAISFDPESPALLPFFLAFSGLLVLGVALQIVRYRTVSTEIERQQTKWVVLGIFLLLFSLQFSFVYEFVIFPPGGLSLIGRLAGWVVYLLGALILPITMAFAILRYRLWDIDLIIRRTLIYGSLTAILALLYFGIVTALQNGLSAITGQQPAFAIVLSTLSIAALFSPLRRRVQDLIDRRFYRRKYDAEEALANFSLTVRDEVDLESLTVTLIGVIEETIQPKSVSVWLKERSE